MMMIIIKIMVRYMKKTEKINFPDDERQSVRRRRRREKRKEQRIMTGTRDGHASFLHEEERE